MENMKVLLRNLNVLKGSLGNFNTDDVPEDPHELFIEWLHIAIKKEVPEPHAMTLSTIDGNGHPDARVLILKNIDQNGWYFATSSESSKGKQLAEEAKVALTFYWSLLGKQVRIRGKAVEMGSERCAEDFLERSEIARAGALIGKQSNHLISREELDGELDRKLSDVKANPDLVYSSWKLYCVQADQVEFWQGSSDRKHIRLQYRFHENQWTRALLWP
ncbi:pyridoxal 5'-phosphate synthase [Lederbergia wuyishanensis]|uniref:Pyridoxamine 5'-phosphate oxidase n=1 Tax=Lederbergia wuyishanensis TaxID=1347903 RepID=A0ABU0D5Y0_9BACI|nr:pyridoxal 5'-phosphate synthase [Lederbergia wuyishanensis]MCJ8008381.1 pyridoxal 5'-phosphate synthase [Lederbergia wuyishanensis]MDQ0343795.1 pyridoxamine 5'-phosphate oxidase [Lederbergia wuyishanensis]